MLGLCDAWNIEFLVVGEFSLARLSIASLPVSGGAASCPILNLMDRSVLGNAVLHDGVGLETCEGTLVAKRPNGPLCDGVEEVVEVLEVVESLVLTTTRVETTARCA